MEVDEDKLLDEWSPQGYEPRFLLHTQKEGEDMTGQAPIINLIRALFAYPLINYTRFSH